jgi:hypothetical protein
VFPGGALGVGVACIGCMLAMLETVETGCTPFCCKGGVTSPGVPMPEPMSLHAANASEASAITTKNVRCISLQLYRPIGMSFEAPLRQGFDKLGVTVFLRSGGDSALDFLDY